MLKPLIKKLKENLKDLKKQEENKEEVRICDKCGVEKTLSEDFYQKVKYFRSGFSYYCNECNRPKSKD